MASEQKNERDQAGNPDTTTAGAHLKPHDLGTSEENNEKRAQKDTEGVNLQHDKLLEANEDDDSTDYKPSDEESDLEEGEVPPSPPYGDERYEEWRRKFLKKTDDIDVDIELEYHFTEAEIAEEEAKEREREVDRKLAEERELEARAKIDKFYDELNNVDRDMESWSIEKGAPRAPKAMQRIRTQTSLYAPAQSVWESRDHHSNPLHTEGGQLNNMPPFEERPYRNDRPRGGRRGGYRNQNYNGGGGGRKRNFREYDEDDGLDRPLPPRREQPWPKLRRDVVEISDSPMRNAIEDVKDLASMIVKDWQDDFFREHALDLLVNMVLEHPLKIPFMAGIVLNLNLKQPDIVETLLPKYSARAQQAIEAGDWRTLKLLLRFFACAHGLFEGTVIFDVLEQLFNRAVDLQAASADDAIGLEITKVILLTIPFVVAAPGTHREQLKQKASEMLDKTEVIAAAPPASEDMISPYVAVEGENPPELQPVVKILQLQLRSEESGQWMLKFLPHYFEDSSDKNLMSDISEAGKKHDFPVFAVPATINPGPQPLFPEVYFSLYADQDVETVPPTKHLASSIIRDVVVDTINILDFNRTRVAKYLVELDCYWPKDTFAKRATQFDLVRDAPVGTPTWKTEDVAIDALFSQIMKLPNLEHRAVYYHSVIIEMCTQAPTSIAPSLGRAIRFLYRNLETLDVELIYRYTDWFAHHLSNFDFRWKWVEWVDDASLSRIQPRKAFILGLLDKEVRLSFAKRIRQSVPEPLAKCIPSSMDNDIPEWKYRPESAPFHSEAKGIVDCLRSQKPEEEIVLLIEQIIATASKDSTHPSPQLLAIDTFVTTLCYVGSKSLSHALSFVERHKDQLASFSQDPLLPPNADDLEPGAVANVNRVQIVASVVNYWRNTQTGVAVSLVDKLLNYGIITPTSVVDWAFGITNPSSFKAGIKLPETWLYEIVSATVGKVMNRVNQLVASRGEQGIPKPQAEQIEDTLNTETTNTRELFRMMEDVLVGVAEGNNDGMMEEGMGEVVGEGPEDREIRDGAQLALLKAWGLKWLRVFRRRLAAQEKKVKEGMLRWPEPVDPAAKAAAAAAVTETHDEDGVDNMDTAEADGV
ncbi:MAG: hypothetical protein Q9159_003187 [Coniocarpon cinnabarinum]